MKRNSKLLVAAKAVAARAITPLRAGLTSRKERPSPTSDEPTSSFLILEKGTPTRLQHPGQRIGDGSRSGLIASEPQFHLTFAGTDPAALTYEFAK